MGLGFQVRKMVSNFVTALHFAGASTKRFYPVKQFRTVLLSDEQGSLMLSLHVTQRCVLAMGKSFPREVCWQCFCHSVTNSGLVSKIGIDTIISQMTFDVW